MAIRIRFQRRGPVFAVKAAKPVSAAKAATVGVLVAVLLAATGCAEGGKWRSGPGDTGEGPKPTVTITAPKTGATDIPASAEIEFTTEQAASVKVELTDAAGKAVAGELAPDGKTWVPGTTLEYDTKYKATVIATGPEGATTTATSTFTTMAKPDKRIRVSSVVGDGKTVGVAMPMIIQFSRAIPKDQRDAVEQRMTVQSTPAQEGAWRWMNGKEVHYRPKEFWQSGTKLEMRLRTGGVPMGDGWYGRSDLSVSATVGSSLVMVADNTSKHMTVTENGKVIRRIPISLGRASMPSSSGTMVIMDRKAKTVFDTMDSPDPANRYRMDIQYAQRLTWGGEFIHAAPWSVGDQGKRNVSHGCINMSTENAAWLFSKTKVGDPVTIRGTERKLQWGNGWTDWSMPWEEYSA